MLTRCRSRHTNCYFSRSLVCEHKEFMTANSSSVCNITERVCSSAWYPCCCCSSSCKLIKCRITVHLKHALHKDEVTVYICSVIKCSEFIYISSFTTSCNSVRVLSIDHVVVVPCSNAVNVVRIVVSVLSTAEFITPYNHRNTTGEHLQSNVVTGCTSVNFSTRTWNIVSIPITAIAWTKRPCIIVL